MKELTLKEQADRLNYKAKPAPHRVNIRVPFGDKEQAKALGAKWDGTLKTWGRLRIRTTKHAKGWRVRLRP